MFGVREVDWSGCPHDEPWTRHSLAAPPALIPTPNIIKRTGPRVAAVAPTDTSLPSLGTSVLHLLVAAAALALDARLAWACFAARAALLHSSSSTTTTTTRNGSSSLPHWATRLFLLYAWGFTFAPFLLLALPLQLSLRTQGPSTTWRYIIHPPAAATKGAAVLPYLAAAWAAAALCLRLALGLLLLAAFLRSCYLKSSGGSSDSSGGPLSPTRASHVQGLSRRAAVYVAVGTLLSLALWLAAGYNSQLGLVSSTY